jgi:hypothetical protein
MRHARQQSFKVDAYFWGRPPEFRKRPRRGAVTAHSGCADPQSFSRIEGHGRKALSSRRLIAGLVVVTYVDHAVCHSEQKFSAVSIVPL